MWESKIASKIRTFTLFRWSFNSKHYKALRKSEAFLFFRNLKKKQLIKIYKEKGSAVRKIFAIEIGKCVLNFQGKLEKRHSKEEKMCILSSQITCIESTIKHTKT